MKRPATTEGLPDAGGLNIDYQELLAFEPTDDQRELIRSDLKAIADRVRAHLTHEFTVSTRLQRTQDGLHGQVIVEFPTGTAIGPGIPITADRFDGAGTEDWNGPIPPDEIETVSREITRVTVQQWATLLQQVGAQEARPAS